ncbi:Bug family tripartite tricarboxylate transporter substrate binding protein [Humitalea sp. 24SJ18S-53]|uniref:Bug family tripartite tricarboxylate transporter substrate binding protein n=1 Tax=Humitalea sp. 24SJ18S-53 TaxID=3422307 RepID=UPI003D673FC9
MPASRSPHPTRRDIAILLRGLGAGALAVGLCPASATAADWRPDRTVRLVVSFAPGGSVDTFARTLQPYLSQALGQSVLVENQGGANTLLATRQVAASPPDGLTLLVTSDSLSINQALLPDAGYDARTSFAPVALGISAAQILVTHPNSGIRSIDDYAARLRARPGSVNIGVPGWGAIGHLVGETLNQRLGGLRAEFVAYRGGAPATIDLLAGTIDALWITLPAVTPYVRDGRLVGLAVSTAARDGALPQVPTVAETVVPGFDITTWQGILAPAGTPPDIVASLYRTIATVLGRDDVRRSLNGLGFTVIAASPPVFAEHIAKAVDGYAQVIAAAGIKPGGA